MSRSRPRTSRLLLLVLGLTVAIGVFTFASRYRPNTNATTVEPSTTPALAPDNAAPVVATRVTAPAAKPATPTPPTTIPAEPPAATRPTIAVSSTSLKDAEKEADAGRPLKARDIYNAALVSGTLSEEDTRVAKHQLAALNESIVFSRESFDSDPWSETFVVPPGGVLAVTAKRCKVTPELLQRINGIADPRKLRAGQRIKLLKGPIHAVVDKSDFTIDLYFGAPGGEGSSYITTFSVGLGKDDSTPTGKWLVESGKKLVNPTYYSPADRGQGVIDADDPKNPLGEYWIGLTGIDGHAVGKASYGIHGTIEPDSIGKMDSMGCIRLLNEDVGRVYEMLVEGHSTVIVKD